MGTCHRRLPASGKPASCPLLFHLTTTSNSLPSPAKICGRRGTEMRCSQELAFRCGSLLRWVLTSPGALKIEIAPALSESQSRRDASMPGAVTVRRCCRGDAEKCSKNIISATFISRQDAILQQKRSIPNAVRNARIVVHDVGRRAQDNFHGSHRGIRGSQTRRIITSVDLINAATMSPAFKRISCTASAVMIDVMCCSPIDNVTWAISPLILMPTTRPTS